jgi:amidase
VRVDEYAACDATALAGLVRRREVSAEEAYAAAVEAIRVVNSELNAVADGPWERPLDYATDGPFSGVPFVLKDMVVHPQGVPMRFGTRLSGDGVVLTDDSYVVRRFREAGLATAALTTSPEFGSNVNTEALVYGPTRNPWDVTRTAGGSSGGTAALVAAGAVPVGHGNDGGGSIRIPAAFNALVGLKPSRGRISDGPDHQEVLFGFATEGVHTRTVRDCAALLDAVAGAMPGDKVVIKGPARPWSREVGADVGPLRIALHARSWSETEVDPEVAAAVDAVGRQLEDLGHHVEMATPRFDWHALLAAELTIFAAGIVQAVAAMSSVTGNQPGPETLEHTTLALYEHGRTLSVLDMANAMQIVNQLNRTVGESFASWDLLLTPTVATPPLPLGYHDASDSTLDAEGWIRRVFGECCFTPLFNLSGTPAISLPLGWTEEGLPIGAQLAAPMCDEATLIRVGSQLEEAIPWSGHRPAIHATRLSSERSTPR